MSKKAGRKKDDVQSKGEETAAHPGYSAEWKDEDGRSGVHTSSEGIVWWTAPSGNGGRFGEVGRAQSYDDYLTSQNGVSGTPRHIEQELEQALKVHGLQPSKVKRHPPKV